MKDEKALRQRLKEVFQTQTLGVLCTHNEGQPYGSLVAFAATEDLKSLLFATTRATRKFANLCRDRRVAMVIDTRSNREEDFHDAIAVTAVGHVEEIKGKSRDRHAKHYLSKHPHLVDFIGSPTCALLRIEVDTFYIVQRFQNVVELHMKP